MHTPFHHHHHPHPHTPTHTHFYFVQARHFTELRLLHREVEVIMFATERSGGVLGGVVHPKVDPLFLSYHSLIPTPFAL